MVSHLASIRLASPLSMGEGLSTMLPFVYHSRSCVIHINYSSVYFHWFPQILQVMIGSQSVLSNTNEIQEEMVEILNNAIHSGGITLLIMTDGKEIPVQVKVARLYCRLCQR